MIEFEKYLENKEEILFINKIHDLSVMLYNGIKRKDGKTDYFNHVENVAKKVLEYGYIDIVSISVAYLHDVFEETKTTAEELKSHIENILIDVNLSYKENMIKKIIEEVNILTFHEIDDKNYNSYLKASYLKKVSSSDDDVLFVKIADRLSNVLDFYNSGNVFYSKKYFLRGEILFGEAIERFNFYKFSLKDLEMLKINTTYLDDDSNNNLKYTINKYKRLIKVYEKIIENIENVKNIINRKRV